MDGSGSAFAHAFGPAITMRRRGFYVIVFHLRHIHRRDGRVIAEGAGKHVANRIVHAILHESRADAMRSCAIDLAFYDWRINHGATIVDRDIIQNARNESVTLDFNHGDVELRSIG